ncbi:DeoR/GlpR family DNA-binding transcription regulator [Tenuibacillus multivorans]|uniref:DNA-binding transcriptional regulator of sugar metabolism, DeoR/GlpR family n=1 Tax=Tenuibacillus multivorans TaxID=237069 RepID=A0A1H0AKU3_9BACI|nr:DeoR/GlpR family DNA-binding transcription regulator [Tenuibacillus multivorans]GEL78190.1 DeoR family transcriptional regulator [Tenuibacillus multivorans]SDN34160.1 DNA-binding transcriptional regulator of sugar metabolism, DeoR/GlpR family [Tenuibacillus multivorans]
MFSEERRTKILEKIRDQGRVLAKDLAKQFNVSVDSIRRDLSIMEEDGLLQRTHGGAIPIKRVREMPQPPANRYGEGSEEQNAIAREAVKYIEEDQTVFIGGAAIHFVLLKYLPTHIHFSVLTNSVEIAYHLRGMDNVTTYLIGGLVKSSGNITDALANQFAGQFSVDVSFATAGNITFNGLSTATPEVSVIHQTIINRSKKVIGIVDHEKFGTDMFSHMCPLSELDLIITDHETPHDKVKDFEVEVLVVP